MKICPAEKRIMVYLKHLCLCQQIGLFHNNFLKVTKYGYNEFSIDVYRQINHLVSLR